jgi:hypothetical protein
MLALTQATAAAFAARQIRIEPILSVCTDTVNNTWTIVPPSLLVARPARSSSPVLSRTPVMRMDIEIVPNPAMRALFLEGRIVRYQEVINGQLFDRFWGNLERPEPGWKMINGCPAPTLKVAAYSRSQRLTKLDYEVIYQATTVGPSATQAVVLTYVVQQKCEVSFKQASGDDGMLIDHCFQPNTGVYVATITIEGDPVGRTGGTHFTILYRAGSNDLAVHWISSAPASGARYVVTFYQVVALMVPMVPTYWTFGSTTAAVSPVYVMRADVPYSEYAPEMIDQSHFARQVRFSPSRSHPTVYTRAGSATAIAAEDTKAEEWSPNWSNGYVSPTPITGALGTVRIYAVTQYAATDVLLVGATQLLWPDATNAGNSLDFALATLCGAATVPNDFDAINPDPRKTNISLGDYRLKSKGDAALQTLLANVAVNYCVYDAPDGYTRGRYITQALIKDFSLTQVTALRDVALTNGGRDKADVYTMVRVRSPNVTGYQFNYVAPPSSGPPDVAGYFPAFDSTKWTNWMNMFESYSGTATPTGTTLDGVAGGYFMWCSSPISQNFIETVKTINFSFEGEIRVFRSTLPNALVSTGTTLIPTEANREYLSGYERLNAPTGSPVTVTINVPQLSSYGEGGVYPEQLWIELRGCTRCPAPNVHFITTTIDRAILAAACVTDQVIGGWSGAWQDHQVFPPLSVVGDYRMQIKAATTDFLQRWMMNPSSCSGANTSNFYWNWAKHRVKTVDSLTSLSLVAAEGLAKAYMDDSLRRATAQEADVLVEAAFEIGDTVAVTDAVTGLVANRTIVGFRDGSSFETPTTTLELADFT